MPSNNETTTKFKVDISDLKKGIQEANRQIKLANAEFKSASASMDNWGKSADGLSAKINQTEKVLKAQKSILNDYKKQLSLIVEEYGENSKEADEMRIKIENQRATVIKNQKALGDYQSQLKALESEQAKAATSAEKQASAYEKLQKTIDSQESDLKALKSEYASVILEQGKNSDSANELAREIDRLSSELNENKNRLREVDDAADDLDKSLDDVSDSARDAGNSGFSVLKGALANLVAKGVEVAISAVKRLGSEIVELGKQSIANYAEYEQLVGGVETLFKESADEVKKYADNAFKTAGLSANDYMETVTSFSASLLQGLNGDTAKAAKIADQAITDMSDNANKMGSDMSSIQNAYQGFAKQNYTMLDNLKLGYGGTQSEMARLINDSGVLGKEIEVTAETVNQVSFDKIIEAIHVVQTEMGITGTTAKEAASTIEGSKNAMQAAWQNLLRGLADENADLGALFDIFMDSAETYLKNILPRVETLINRVVDFIKEKLEEKFPATAKALEVLWDAFRWIIDNGKTIISILGGIVAAFAAFKIITTVSKAIGIFKTFFGVIKAGQGVMAAFNAIAVANPIGLIVAAVVGLIAAFALLWKNSEKFRNFWIGMWEGIKKAVSVAVDWIKGVFDKIVGFFKENWQSILLFLINPFAGLFKYAYDHFEGFRKFVDGIVQAIVGFFSNMGEKVAGFFSNLWEGIQSIWSTVAQWFSDNVAQPIINFFQPVVDFFMTAWNIIKELAEGVWNTIVLLWGLAADWFNENVIQPVVEFFTELWESIKEKASAAWEGIKKIWSIVSNWFSEKIIQPVVNFFSKMWEGIKNGATTAWNFVKGVWNVVSGWFNNTIVQPVVNFFSGMWDKVKKGASSAWEGIKSVFGKVADWFGEKFSAAWSKVKAVFSTGGKIFDGIKDGIVNAFKTVVNAIIRGINKVIAIPFNGVNKALDTIRNLSIAGVKPFSGLLSRLTVPQIPELAEGGVLAKGQVGLLEGDGAEAVVPLDQNKKWIAATAQALKQSLVSEGVLGAGGGNVVGGATNYTFNQYNTSPKALSRLEIYRQTKNQLDFAKGV